MLIDGSIRERVSSGILSPTLYSLPSIIVGFNIDDSGVGRVCDSEGVTVSFFICSLSSIEAFTLSFTSVLLSIAALLPCSFGISECSKVGDSRPVDGVTKEVVKCFLKETISSPEIYSSSPSELQIMTVSSSISITVPEKASPDFVLKETRSLTKHLFLITSNVIIDYFLQY